MTTNNKIALGAILFVLGGMGLAYVWSLTQDEGAHPDWEERSLEVKELKASLTSIADYVKTLSGRGACEADNDCHVLGIGAKICGGYNDFLVYSIRDSREEKLLESVKEFNTKAERLNVVSFKVQKCGGKPPPAHCLKNICRLSN